MVCGGQGVEQVHPAGGVQAEAVAVEGVYERLVQGDPQPDPVAERGGDGVGVPGEVRGGVPVVPAAVVLYRLWQVPVVQRGDRVDAPGQQGVHEPVVEGDPGRVGRAGTGGVDAWPGDGEPVRGDAQSRHQIHVGVDPVVVVAGDVAGSAVGDAVGFVAERVPDARAPAVFGGGAFDLVRGRGYAPVEAGREPHLPLLGWT